MKLGDAWSIEGLVDALRRRPNEQDRFDRLEEACFEVRDWSTLTLLYLDGGFPAPQDAGFWEARAERLLEVIEPDTPLDERSAIHLLCGRLCETLLDNTQQALAYYQLAFKEHPENLDSLRRSRRIYAATNKWALVLRLYALERQVHPNRPEAAAILRKEAWILRKRLDQPEEANARLLEARKLLRRGTLEMMIPSIEMPAVAKPAQLPPSEPLADAERPSDPDIVLPVITLATHDDGSAQRDNPVEPPHPTETSDDDADDDIDVDVDVDFDNDQSELATTPEADDNTPNDDVATPESDTTSSSAAPPEPDASASDPSNPLEEPASAPEAPHSRLEITLRRSVTAEVVFLFLARLSAQIHDHGGQLTILPEPSPSIDPLAADITLKIFSVSLPLTTLNKILSQTEIPYRLLDARLLAR